MKIHYRKTYRSVLSAQIVGGVGSIEFDPIGPGYCAYVDLINLDSSGATVPIARGTMGGPPEITLQGVGPRNLSPGGLWIGSGEQLRFALIGADGEVITIMTQWRIYQQGG